MAVIHADIRGSIKTISNVAMQKLQGEKVIAAADEGQQVWLISNQLNWSEQPFKRTTVVS